MEQNVIQFIIDNIMFFLPLGIIGIASTVVLYFTGKRDEKNREFNEISYTIKLFNKKINYFLLVYSFIFFMMLLIGFLSEFYIATIVGTCIALIPIVIILLFEYTTIFQRKIP